MPHLDVLFPTKTWSWLSICISVPHSLLNRPMKVWLPRAVHWPWIYQEVLIWRSIRHRPHHRHRHRPPSIPMSNMVHRMRKSIGKSSNWNGNWELINNENRPLGNLWLFIYCKERKLSTENSFFAFFYENLVNNFFWIFPTAKSSLLVTDFLRSDRHCTFDSVQSLAESLVSDFYDWRRAIERLYFCMYLFVTRRSLIYSQKTEGSLFEEKRLNHSKDVWNSPSIYPITSSGSFVGTLRVLMLIICGKVKTSHVI